MFILVLSTVNAYGDPAPEVREKSRGEVSVSPGLAVLNGKNGWVMSGEVSARLGQTSPFFLGLLIGYSHWGVDSLDVSAYQFLPTLLYRFEQSEHSDFHPYIGISTGLAAVRSENGAANLLGLKGDDHDSYFEVLCRPGVEIGDEKGFRFGLESRFGVIGTQFTYSPQMSISFAF